MEKTNKTSPIHIENKLEESTATGSAKAAAQCSVIIVYKAKISSTIRNVTVVWSKTLINHSLTVSINRSGLNCEPLSTCRIDLKPWPFWGKKGFKSLDIGDQRIDLFWDLRSAKYSSGGCPEPTGSYYVALVRSEEVVLLLGDLKKKAYKRTKARPSLEDARMVSKMQNVFGKRSFPTRLRFDGWRKEYDIVVENSISGGEEKDAEMWIRIDGVVMIHVSNLQWKFRGNETVVVEDLPVQVFWDVHDWFFGGAGMGKALFIFKPGAEMTEVAEMTVVEEEGNGSEVSWSSEEREEVVKGASGCEQCAGASEFCFMLYAWRVEK